jgi:hypothetical protein
VLQHRLNLLPADTRKPFQKFVDGSVCQINRPSGSEQGGSAKATEEEAGQPARAAEGNTGPAPCSLPSQSVSDGLNYLANKPTVAPPSRFSKSAFTGMRVPTNSQTPPTLPGIFSTDGH